LNIRNTLTRSVAALTAVLAGAYVTSANAETIYAADDTEGELVSFDSATPGTVTALTISGLQANEHVRALAWYNDTLYLLGSFSHLYTVDPSTATATQVGSQFANLLDGVYFGFAGGPSGSGLLYVGSDSAQNMTINATTGATTVGPSYSPSDVDALAQYGGNFYSISVSANTLNAVNPVTGAETAIGSTGAGNLTHPAGFDISPYSGIAYVTAVPSGGTSTELYTENLSTGALTAMGIVGHTDEFASGLEGLVAVPEPNTAALFILSGAGFLFRLVRRRQ
jgi:hypothetical protein